MSKYTITALANMIEKKLSHNFGVAPSQASDELFYKACVLVLLEIMNDANHRRMLSENTMKKFAQINDAPAYQAAIAACYR